jgi:hypothetical protein
MKLRRLRATLTVRSDAAGRDQRGAHVLTHAIGPMQSGTQ